METKTKKQNDHQTNGFEEARTTPQSLQPKHDETTDHTKTGMKKDADPSAIASMIERHDVRRTAAIWRRPGVASGVLDGGGTSGQSQVFFFLTEKEEREREGERESLEVSRE